MFDFLVIGKGLIGSAAAKYVSGGEGSAAILGPDEPADPAAHPGVFASHYDQGRITRRLSKDAVWSWLAGEAIDRYPRIAMKSGLTFHHAVGGLYVNPPGKRDKYLERVETVARQEQLPAETLDAAALQVRFPAFSFPAGSRAIYEPPPAGYINPRDLIRAQLTIAAHQGAEIIRETAVTITPAGDHMQVTTDAGRRLQAGKVLLATGAFTNCHDLLPRKLPLRVKTETIILAEVDEERWIPAPLPTLIYQVRSPDLADIYLLPPIRYPDGRLYVKMGANTRADSDLEGLEALRRWFIQGESDRMKPAMQAAVRALLPGLPFCSWQTKRCAITYTPSGYPLIDAVLDERLFVAAGGNGSSAKSADTLGRLAAKMLRQPGRRPPEMAPFAFETGSH